MATEKTNEGSCADDRLRELPEEVGAMPASLHHAAYLPGLAMAERCAIGNAELAVR